jgi:RNA polymerase-binding transcription factor DksA
VAAVAGDPRLRGMTRSERIRNAGLSSEQLETLRLRLERLRAGLHARIERHEKPAREADKLAEPMDAAEQTREQDDAVALVAHDREQLRAVEDALRRMDDGRYGVSAISGAPIPFERLLVVPWTDHDSDEQPASQTL